MQRRALARADVGVDGGGQQRVREAQHPVIGRSQDIAGGERVRGGRDVRRITARERCDMTQLGVVAEHRDGPRNAGRVVGQAHQPHGDGAQHRLGCERADALGVVRLRQPSLGLDRADELAEQKAVALGHAPAGFGEDVVGRRQHAGHDVASPFARQRSRPQRLAGRVRRDLREQVVGRARLPQAPRDDDRDVHRGEALQQVQHEAQRRAIGPVGVVDDDQHRPGAREVRHHPEEAVHDRIRAIVGLVAAPVRRALEQRAGERGGAAEQPVAGVVVGSRQQRLEELQRDAEGKAGLELRRRRAHDGAAAGAGLRDGGAQQRALADAGVTLDEQQPPVARARPGEQCSDRLQLSPPFEEDPRSGACDGDCGALYQKTGELP